MSVVIEASSGSAEDNRAERTQMERKHVFAVNGSPEFLDVIREMFQDESYNVTTTNFVPETLDQVAALQPDLLLIDLVFRSRAGWELLERLRADALTRCIPVIVTSTDRDMLEYAEADRDRFAGNRYLVKPFDIDEIMSTVHEMIGTA